jgi:uracil-DNA glycosylase family 4
MKTIIDILKFYEELGVEYTKKLNIKTKDELLNEIAQNVSICKKCELSKTRTNPVFGEGSVNAKLMFVGEAPGRDEDIQGKPFVGRAGRLLNELLLDVGIQRNDVYIANCLKCRPPNNRDPNTTELQNCFGYLKNQIAIIKPKVIATLGRYSTYQLTGEKGALGILRGRVFTFNNIKIVPLYHPAYLLRNPKAIDIFLSDLRKLKSLMTP